MRLRGSDRGRAARPPRRGDREYKGKPGALIPVLQLAQGIFGYLPEVALKHIALKMGKPYSEVAGVVGFYSFFSTVPRGKHVIRVCLGTACYVRGGVAVLDAFKKDLGIDVGGPPKTASSRSRSDAASAPAASRRPACAAAAAPGSPPASSGSSPPSSRATRSTSSATPTRATPARSWTARCSKATRTPSSRAWPSAPSPSARTRATSTCAPSIRWRVERLEIAINRPREYGLLGDDIIGTGFASTSRSHGFRRLRLRRRDRAHDLHRGQARRAAAAAAVPGPQGPLGQAQRPQQRRDLRQRRRPSSSTAPSGTRSAYGTEKSKGTKVFALSGNVNNTGLVEVDRSASRWATHLRHRRRHPGGKNFKAAQLGGPSGGCIPKEHLNVRWTTSPCRSSAPSWARAASSSWTRTPAWSTWRASSSTSPGRELRQVPAVPRRHQAHARDRRSHLRRRGRRGRHRAPHRSRRDHQADGALRPRPDGAQPRALDHPPLPPRVRGAHQGQVLRSRRLRHAVHGALLQRLPGQRQHPRLRQPGRRAALRRGPQGAPRAQPAGQHLRPRVLPPLREQVPARRLDGARRHPPRQALHGRAGEGPSLPEIQIDRGQRGAQGRRHRRRPRRPLLRLLPRAPRLQAGRLRGRAKAGGMLVQAIPAYRLPREELEREIA
jgi:hypothetical protein